MRQTKQKIKLYRREFSPVPNEVFRLPEFRISLSLAIILVAATTIYFYSTAILHSQEYKNLIYYIVAAEIPMVFGFALARLRIEQNRVQRRLALRGRPKFRATLYALDLLQRERIKELFCELEEYEEYAKKLTERWEWRNTLKLKSSKSAETRARSFYSLPSASHIANYIAAFLAIAAGVVISLINQDQFYSSIPDILLASKSITWLLINSFVIPLAVVIIPLAAIWDLLAIMVIRALEWVDDDYLSRYSFYKFINEILEKSDRQGLRLLMRSTGFAYWLIAMLTSDLKRLKRQHMVSIRAIRINKCK
ncbi:hypothetical protein NNO07_16080 [Pseudomonas resinovorans]|uniref:Uncharacterized protein n=1 Tax=Metapseudomonas resinovorans TaxID=53412 RepID=A0ABT4Y6U1_METRE|nr:hypothetical protein [Pseudomonas resinovorans]MDA8484591.1 hypothetical protein [Pseudomonas resinovorans]